MSDDEWRTSWETCFDCKLAIIKSKAWGNQWGACEKHRPSWSRNNDVLRAAAAGLASAYAATPPKPTPRGRGRGRK